MNPTEPLIETKQVERLHKKKCCTKFCCCRAVCLTFVIIPVLSVISCVILYFLGYSRVDNITMFNERSLQWNNTDSVRFSNLHLNLTINDESILMEESDDIEFNNYPVRDTCNEDGDPFAGCIDTKVLFYASKVEFSSTSYSFTVAQDEHTPFLDELVPSTYNELVMNTTLDCNDVATCTYNCIKLGGRYTAKTGQCKIKRYLQSVCFRVAFNGDNTLKQDVPPTEPLNGYEITSEYSGCYGDRAWHYAHYDKEQPETLLFEIRYYNDPYIVASSITDGCSSDPESMDEFCMGLSRYQMHYGYVIASGILFVIVAMELFFFTLCALIKKDSICIKKPKTPTPDDTYTKV